jgi:thiazole synthase ThiGH ThiG subunit
MTAELAREALGTNWIKVEVIVPEPMSEPIGITAAAPRSASRLHTTGSSLQ